MGKKKHTESQNSLNEKQSIVYWTILFFMGIMLFIAPFNKAVFNGYSSSFEGAILSTLSGIFLTGILLAIYLIQHTKQNLQIDLIHSLVWFLPVMYVIPALLHPASSYFSMQSVYLQAAYSIVFVMGFYLIRLHFSRQLLIQMILGTGASIIVFGMMNWFGDASLWSILKWSNMENGSIYKDAVLIGPDGARLTSVFQYANSYAAFLIAMIIALLVVVAHHSRTKYAFFYSLLLVPAFISLLLTLSRGGLLIFPVILLLTLPFLRWRRQLYLLVSLTIICIVSLLVLDPITQYGNNLQSQFSGSLAFKGWGILIVASMIAASMITLMHLLIMRRSSIGERTHWNKISLDWIVPLGVVILGVSAFTVTFSTNLFTSLLPDNIQQRIENINFQQNSVLERGTFYSDAWKVVQDYPIFGAGGGAWATFYEKYQNNPYVSNQTHNYFLQILLEVGFIGFIVLIVFLAGVYVYFIRSYFRSSEETRTPYLVFYVFATAILVHSILDFNMSYIYLSLLVFICLGGMFAIPHNQAFKWHIGVKGLKLRFLYPTFVAVLCLTMLFVSLNQLSANRAFQTVQIDVSTGKESFQKIMSTINSSINRSLNPEYIDMKLQLLISAYKQTQQPEYAQQSKEILALTKFREPYNKMFVYRELELYKLQQQYTQASELLELALPNYPWDINLYVELATSYYQSGLTKLNDGSMEQAQVDWNKAKSLLVRVHTKSQQLESLSKYQFQGRAFSLTPDLALPLGQIAFYEGAYDLALEYLITRLDQQYNDANDIEATLFYTAALSKLNKPDDAIIQDMYSKLDEATQKIAKTKYEALLQY